VGKLLRLAMGRVFSSGVQIGCGGGCCVALRSEVVQGEYEVKAMSKNHVSDEEAAQGFALACRVLPNSDLLIKSAPKAKS